MRDRSSSRLRLQRGGDVEGDVRRIAKMSTSSRS
jgi:hypothetical protein